MPELARAYPERDRFTFDPFTVTVELRDAEWSDGKPITANDVRFTWTKFREGPTAYRYRLLRNVDVLDAQRFRLRFDRPVRRWWSLFSVDDMVLPMHAYSEKWARKPNVSGGPFVFDGWTDGLKIALRRNDRYWARPPPLAGIDVFFVPDTETRLQLIDRGEIDALFAEGESNLGRRATAYGFGVLEGAVAGDPAASGAWGPTWWELNLDPQALRGPVARAVVEAIAPRLAAEILEDSGRPMGAIPANFTVADTSRGAWFGRGRFDEATKILDEGGVRGGEERAEFQLAYPRGGASSAIASFIHFRLREIGLTAELVGLEPDIFEREWVREERAPVTLRLRRGADAPDVASYASTARSAIDDDITGSLTDVDVDEIASGPLIGVASAPWSRAQRALADAASVAPLTATRSWLVAVDGVWGPHATGAANGPLWNAGTWTVQRA